MHWKRKLAFGLIPVCALLAVGELGARVVGAEDCGAIVPDAPRGSRRESGGCPRARR